MVRGKIERFESIESPGMRGLASIAARHGLHGEVFEGDWLNTYHAGERCGIVTIEPANHLPGTGATYRATMNGVPGFEGTPSTVGDFGMMRDILYHYSVVRGEAIRR